MTRTPAPRSSPVVSSSTLPSSRCTDVDAALLDEQVGEPAAAGEGRREHLADEVGVEHGRASYTPRARENPRRQRPCWGSRSCSSPALAGVRARGAARADRVVIVVARPGAGRRPAGDPRRPAALRDGRLRRDVDGRPRGGHPVRRRAVDLGRARGPSRPDPATLFLTHRARGSGRAALVGTVGDAYAARTGRAVPPRRGRLRTPFVYPDIDDVQRANARADVRAVPGLLGQTVLDAGLRVSVTSSRGPTPARLAPLVAMDEDGVGPAGRAHAPPRPRGGGGSRRAGPGSGRPGGDRRRRRRHREHPAPPGDRASPARRRAHRPGGRPTARGEHGAHVARAR